MDTGVVADGNEPGVGHDDVALFNARLSLVLYKMIELAALVLIIVLLNRFTFTLPLGIPSL